MFSGGFNNLDKSLILLSVTTAVAGTLLFQNTQAFFYQCGDLFNALGIYLLLRCLIRDEEDVVRVIRVFAVIVTVLGGVMIVEHLMNGWNPYALLGGAKASYFSADLERNGVRATASFGTPIIAGVFGAVSFSFFVGLWLKDRKQHTVAALGMFGSTAMTLASNSSTPLMAYFAALLGFCLWPARGALRIIRWGIFLTLASLQMVMKAPVYHLITRIDISGSSYHRYALIDTCVHHFGDWWLIGTNANPTWGWDMWDTADQYVATAYGGGLLGLISLIAVIVFGFKYVGRARKAALEDTRQALFFWGLGSALLAYVVSFFGISLWDQSTVEWYALLAFIGAVTAPQAAYAAKTETLTAPNLRFPEPVGSPAALSLRERLRVSQEPKYKFMNQRASKR